MIMRRAHKANSPCVPQKQCGGVSLNEFVAVIDCQTKRHFWSLIVGEVIKPVAAQTLMFFSIKLMNKRQPISCLQSDSFVISYAASVIIMFREELCIVRTYSYYRY